MPCLHPLYSHLPRPGRLNNPFGYIPSPLCQQAAEEVRRYIESVATWQEELRRGKMFGVLVVEDGQGQLGFLAAYSGLLADRNDWDWFVPPVFDFLQPDGYFKQEESAISHINQQIGQLEQSEEWHQAHKQWEETCRLQTAEQMTFKEKMAAAKARRDQIRLSRLSHPDQQAPTEEELVRESQKMKADLRRMRKRHTEALTPLADKVNRLEKESDILRHERKRRSDALQRWLFTHFVVRNGLSEERHLLDIFSNTSTPIPPSGAGECCAPKLLQYAYLHQLRPLSIAEFWWGDSPVGTLRRHLGYYPACRGKCLPILTHMLQGIDVDDNPWEQTKVAVPEIIYEDEWIIVLCKPAGMLSVPGKISQQSVWSFVRSHCPEAKTKQAHQDLQAQFHHRTIEKTYVALLESPLPADMPSEGIITLPLSADPLDRPRQQVDYVNGKPAITRYATTDRQRVILQPKTGRTHQLRVHCAHPDGLNRPIKGDTLYGSPSDRLYLHAESITFVHPLTKKRVTFSSNGTPF